MLSINHLSIQFGDKHLFKDVSVRVHPADRIGLAGVNGAGKSTLVKIMSGARKMDAGVVVRGKRTTCGYLPQEAVKFPAGRTLFSEAETAFAEALALKKELDTINKTLETASPDSSGFENLLQRQGEIQHILEQSDIFQMQSQIEKVLGGLGFKQQDFQKSCNEFSGGWIMRLMLAKLLLSKPSLLLLDEPTNHLDIESLTWLEDFLRSYDGALIIISHDRAFLDGITTTIWELSLGNLNVYKGNYTSYLKEKESRMKIQRAAYENQQAQIQQTMRFVERFRAKSTKASQVQSRLRQLEKLEKVEIDDVEHSVSFRFPPSPPSGRLAVDVSSLGKQFNGVDVFCDLNFQLHRGEKMAVVGVNGAGKSTLVRLLAGIEKPDSGTISYGHNVSISYFGQHQARELDPRLTVLETISLLENEMTNTRIRTLLATFLFRGDEVDKKVQVLSGGEKSRLALAKMIASPASLLILDEPTNHLDMTSQEILQEAMRQYDGAIIVVSHNRFFLNAFVGKVLEIKNGHASVHEGNIDDYLIKAKEERIEAAGIATTTSQDNKEETNGPGKPKGKEARKLSAKIRQEKNRLLSPLKTTLAGTEKEIESFEDTKSELEKALADPELYKNQDLFSEKSREYGIIEKKLSKCYQEWEAIQSKIDALESRFDKEIEPPD